jgi:OLD-like protein
MVKTRRVVIVEGESDRVALETLAQRRGRDLAAEGVDVVPIGGAHAIRRYLERLKANGSDVKLAGLVDAGQEDVFRRAVDHTGFDIDLYVCDTDLEDELIRAVGLESVEKVIESQGELRSLRSLQKQPAQRGRTTLQHVRRFISSHSGRKALYARLLVEALDLDQVPQPLDSVLATV